jgi:hypothetical protein
MTRMDPPMATRRGPGGIRLWRGFTSVVALSGYAPELGGPLFRERTPGQELERR